MIEDEEVRSFFQFLISNRARNEFTSDLKDYVTDAKHNMQWRFQFMTWERQRAYDYDDGKAAGIQIGEKKKAVEDARNLLKKGISPELIAECIGLPLDEVEKFATEVSKK